MRLIDVDDLKRYMCNKCGERSTCEYQGYGCSTLADIDEQPTIEAEPVKHGEWRVLGYTALYCTECNVGIPVTLVNGFSYCPFCGARMDGKELSE